MSAAAGKAVCDWLAARRGEMLELLEAAVNIDSGSSHKQGADRMAALFETFVDVGFLQRVGDGVYRRRPDAVMS